MNINCKSKPYLAKLRRDGKHVHLGCFVTPEEAALAFARSSAAHAVSSRKRKPPSLRRSKSRMPMTTRRRWR